MEPNPKVVRGGEASDDEVAAIVAAIEMTWPRPVAEQRRSGAPRWRFSGRWWSKPVPARRVRPVVGNPRDYLR